MTESSEIENESHNDYVLSLVFNGVRNEEVKDTELMKRMAISFVAENQNSASPYRQVPSIFIATVDNS